MNVADVMKLTGALASVSRDLGVDSATAQSGVEALLPTILGCFRKQVPRTSGCRGGPLDLDGDGNPLDELLGIGGHLSR